MDPFLETASSPSFISSSECSLWSFSSFDEICQIPSPLSFRVSTPVSRGCFYLWIVFFAHLALPLHHPIPLGVFCFVFVPPLNFVSFGVSALILGPFFLVSPALGLRGSEGLA